MITHDQAQALLGKTATVTRFAHDPFTGRRHETTTRGRVEAVTEKSLTIREKPIRGISNNVTSVVSLDRIVEARA